MGCFSAQKSKKKLSQQPPSVPDHDEPLLSGPPSFRRRVRVIQNAQRFINGNPKLRSSLPSYGSRDSSSPLDAELSSMGAKSRSATAELGSSLFDITTLRSRPMPLPSPQRLNAYRLPLPNDPSSSASLSPSSTFTSPRISCSPTATGVNGKVYPSDLQPLPPPRESLAGLRSFSGLRSFTLDELANACPNFDSHDVPSHDGIIKDKAEKQEITVVQVCESWRQGYREWLAEISTVARLLGPHLCKILGFCAGEGLTKRFLVYEKLSKGSLDGLLFGTPDSPPLDWPTRVKIASGAVQGLLSLHEISPGQVLHHDFRSSNIQIDADSSSKLSGYCTTDSNHTGRNQHSGTFNQNANAYGAPETLSRGEISPGSIVWSVGIVILELLTGRQNMDHRLPREEGNLVKWAKPFLMDESRLFLAMDPKLQGRFPCKGAQMIAELVLQCLNADPAKRPTIRKVADVVKSVQEMRYTIRLPLKELSVLSPPYSPTPGRSLVSPTSGKAAYRLTTPVGSQHRSPTQFDIIESPQLKPLIIPPRSCSSSFSMEESLGQTHQIDHTSGPLERLQGW